MTFALLCPRIVSDGSALDDHAVVVEAGRISDVCPAGLLPGGMETRVLKGTLAPGYIDIQVNGGGGVLFNDEPSVDGIRAIGAAHRRFGTTGFLPTLITDTRERMAEAVEAVQRGLDEGIPGLLGIHLEGPFLNPARKGAHDAKYMRPIEGEDIRIMTSLEKGRTLVTLAPEMVPPGTIARLVEAGVIVSAGHTAASSEVLTAARGEGLTCYTHLFNAMPPLAGREPGPVGAALSDPGAFCSMIVDFHHVSETSLRVALAARGAERTILITDAMSVTGTDLDHFTLQDRTIFRRGGRLVTADGTLAGSDLDMAAAVRNCVDRLGVSLSTVIAMATEVPASLLRLDNEIGRIQPDQRANFVLLDGKLKVASIWVDGVEETAG